MTRFALKTLLADRSKLLIALVGVVFSLVLVCIQGGLFLGMIRKSSLLIDNSRADIWVGHRGVRNADIAKEIPMAWLERIRGLPGVLRAEHYIVAAAMMQLPDGEFEGVLVVGADPASLLGTAWAFAEGRREDIRGPDAITIDRLDAWRLGNPKVGDVLEINGCRARVVAETDGILGFITTPYVFTTLEAARSYARMPDGCCSYYLIEALDGTDLEILSRRIRERVPELDVYTADEFSRNTRWYWIVRTGLGMSFGSSTLLGLSVGLVMVAQSLYAFVLDHQPEYATLKAMGAEDGLVFRILLSQSLTIAFLGIAIGGAVSMAIQRTLSTPQLTIDIPFWLVCMGAALSLAICVASSLLPFRRIRLVDPVSVLQE